MKIPLTLVLSEQAKLAASRSCGECHACCVLPRVAPQEGAVLQQGKRGYTFCEQLTTDGKCSCYEDRPEVCRGFACLWRAGFVLGDERRRPDNLGLMFVAEEMNGKGVIEIWELWPGALQEHPGRGVLDSLSAAGFILLCRYYGVPASLKYEGPASLTMGAIASKDAMENPQPLAAYIKALIAAGRLQVPENVDVLLDDLNRMEAGVKMPLTLKRK